MSPLTRRAALATVLLVAAWLRLGALDREGLWLDELFTARAASRGTWGELFAELAGDVHPPLWFALLHLLPDGGDGTWRVPSALAGLAGVGLAALLARALGGGGTHGDRATLLAAALTATAPGLVLLDREARANAPLSAAALALVLLLVRPGGRWGWVALAGAALVNLHPFGAFVLVAAALFLAFDPGDGTGLGLRAGLAAMGLGALALAPWAGVLASQAQHFAASPWYVAPPGDSVGWVLAELADDQPGLWLAPLLGLAVATRLEGPGERRALALVAAFVVGLVLLPQALSYAWAPVLRTRSALPLLPVVLVAAALGLARMGRPGVILGLVAALGQGLAAWSATRLELRKEQWREAAAWAREQDGAGGLVFANHPQLWRRYLGEVVELHELAAPDVDAAPGALVLLAHDLEEPAAWSALGAETLAEARFKGAWARVVGPFSRPVPLRVVDEQRGGAEGTRAQLWGATGVRSGELRARGACRVAVRAHEDAAGAEPARLAVRLVAGEVAVIDEQRAVTGGEWRTEGIATVRGEPGVAPLRIEIDFVNDGVVDGADRNAYLDAVWLDCR